MSGSKEQTFHLKEVSFRNSHQNESLEMQTKKIVFSNPHFHFPGVENGKTIQESLYNHCNER